MRLINFSNSDRRYDNDDYVYDEYNNEVLPLDDDYCYYKTLQENMNDPLWDDYIPEGHRY